MAGVAAPVVARVLPPAVLPAAPPLVNETFVAERIVFDGPLTTAEMQRIEGYLARKWGLNALLPADHPYRATETA